MKYLITCLFFILNIECSAQERHIPKIKNAPQLYVQEFNDFVIWKRDTLNRINSQGLKYGDWIVFKTEYSITEAANMDLGTNNRATIEVDSGRVFSRILQRGLYLDNNRTGIWTYFYKNDNIKAELNFVKGELSGPARFYYNEWPKRIKYQGSVTPKQPTTIFDYFDHEGKR